MASRSKEYVLSTKMTVNDSQFKKKMGGAGKTLKGFGKAAAIGFAVAGAAAVALGTKAAMAASRFETGMAEVSTLSDAAFDQLEDLSQGVLKLTGRLGTDAVEATGALYQAISAGVPAGNAIDFLTIATKAAIGGVTDTETAVDGLTTVMNGFKDQNISAQKAADVMFQTVKLGKTNFEELSRSLFQVIPLAAASGVKFEETAAALATLTAQGMPTRVAATNVRAAIQSLIKPSTDLTTIFNAAGFASGEAAVKQLGFAKAAEIVRTATGGSTSQMTKLLGSIEGVQAILGITGANAEVFAGNLDAIENSAGAATTAFEIMDSTTAATFNKIKSTISNTMIEIGGAVLDYLRPVVDMLQEQLPYAIESARMWFDLHGPAIESAITSVANVFLWVKDQFVIGMGIIIPLLTDWWNWLSKHKPLLIAIFVALGAVIVLSLGPLSLAAAAITGLVVLLGWMSDNWRTVVVQILTYIENLLGGLKWLLQGAEKVPGPWGEIWDEVVTNVRESTKDILEDFKSILGGTSLLVTQTAKLPLPWGKIWDYILRSVGQSVDSVLISIQKMMEGVRAVVSGLSKMPGLEGMFSSTLSSLDSAISNVGKLRSTAKESLQFSGSDKELVDAVVDPIDAAIAKLTEWQNVVDSAVTAENISELLLSPIDAATSAIGGYKEQLLGEIEEIDVAQALADAYKDSAASALDAHELLMGAIPTSITSAGVSGTDAQGVPIPTSAAGAAGSGKAGPKDLSGTFARLLRTIESLAESTRRTTGGALEGLTDAAAKAALAAVGIAAPVAQASLTAAQSALQTGRSAATDLQGALSAALRTLTQHSKTGTAESLAAAQAVVAAVRHQMQQNVASFRDLVSDGKEAASEAIRSAKEVTAAAVRNIRVGVQRELDVARAAGREVAYFIQRANELARQGQKAQAMALLEGAKGQLAAVATVGDNIGTILRDATSFWREAPEFAKTAAEDAAYAAKQAAQTATEISRGLADKITDAITRLTEQQIEEAAKAASEAAKAAVEIEKTEAASTAITPSLPSQTGGSRATIYIETINVSGNVVENERELAERLAEELGRELTERGYLRNDAVFA